MTSFLIDELFSPTPAAQPREQYGHGAVHVLKRNLPPGGAQPAVVAKVLDGWARVHAQPYVGAHRPQG